MILENFISNAVATKALIKLVNTVLGYGIRTYNCSIYIF